MLSVADCTCNIPVIKIRIWIQMTISAECCLYFFCLLYTSRYYELRSNPAAKVGNMGREEHKEMLFWTKEEYKKFSFEMRCV